MCAGYNARACIVIYRYLQCTGQGIRKQFTQKPIKHLSMKIRPRRKKRNKMLHWLRMSCTKFAMRFLKSQVLTIGRVHRASVLRYYILTNIIDVHSAVHSTPCTHIRWSLVAPSIASFKFELMEKQTEIARNRVWISECSPFRRLGMSLFRMFMFVCRLLLRPLLPTFLHRFFFSSYKNLLF